MEINSNTYKNFKLPSEYQTGENVLKGAVAAYSKNEAENKIKSQPDNDNFKGKTLSKKKKTLIALGAVLAAGVGAFAIVKHHNKIAKERKNAQEAFEIIKNNFTEFQEKKDILLLPEKSSKTVEEMQRETFQTSTKEKLLQTKNLAIAAFGGGAVLNMVRDLKKKDDAKDEEIDLKKTILASEKTLREKEIPKTLALAEVYKEDYEENIKNRIDRLDEPSKQLLLRAEKSVECLKNKSCLMKSVETKDGTLLTSFINQFEEATHTIETKDGKLLSIELYRPNGTLSQKGIFRNRPDDYSKTYMSHFIGYNNEGNKVAGTAVFDTEGRVKSYLSRKRNGDLNKVYILNPENGELSRICTTDDEGKKTDVKLEFKDGELVRANLPKTAKLPKRSYVFENGAATTIEAYGKNSDSTPVFTTSIKG